MDYNVTNESSQPNSMLHVSQMMVHWVKVCSFDSKIGFAFAHVNIQSTGTCRYFSGVKPGVDEHTFFLESTGNSRSLVLDAVDSSWCLTSSRVSSFPLSKARDPSLLQSSYPQLQSLQDLGQVTGSSTSRQQQHSFIGSEFGSPEPAKHESQFLRPFFDEWPKARDSWSDIEEDRSNRASFSTTQLSMSFPMASSSDFSTTSSRSPNGESIPEIGTSDPCHGILISDS